MSAIQMESMGGSMGPRGPKHTAKIGMNGRQRDTAATTAGMAHADAERGTTDREASRRYSTSRRSHSRWRTEGPPPVREFTAYLLACSDPYRVEAHVRSTVKQRAISKLSDADLIERYHDLRVLEKQVEGADNGNDVRGGVAWLERAALKERDSAINAELAAVMREFACRGLTEADVFGSRR